MELNYAGLSDKGRLRSDNQDRWGADAEHRLFSVADGVASSSNGALAAAVVTQVLPEYLERHLKTDDLESPDAAERLGQAVAELSDELHAYALTDTRVAGATTTLVAAVVADTRVLIAHLGDSRAYLHRDQKMQRLTADHSIVQALIDSGELTPEKAAEHPARNVITRHVPMMPPAVPDSSAVDLQGGDRILLCSDGLHGVIDDATLAQILGAQEDPTAACEALVGAANDAGGPDNITVVVINVPGSPPESADPVAEEVVP
jgi:serine/threonine protein phosphatase PrpC